MLVLSSSSMIARYVCKKGGLAVVRLVMSGGEVNSVLWERFGLNQVFSRTHRNGVRVVTVKTGTPFRF